jgi:signal transduction histidine kinase
MIKLIIMNTFQSDDFEILNKSSSKKFIKYITPILLLIFMLASLLFAFYFADHQVKTHPVKLNIISKIKFNITTGHLRLEEMITGALPIDYKHIVELHKDVEKSADLLLEGGVAYNWSILGNHDDDMNIKKELIKLKDLFSKFDSLARQRVALNLKSESLVGKKYDKLFNMLITHLDLTEKKYLEHMALELERFEHIELFLITINIIMVLIIIFIFKYFDKIQAKSIQNSLNLNKSIYTQNINLKNAYRTLRDEISCRKEAEAEISSHRIKLRALTSEVSLAEERERRKIAVDLHDGICQTLAVAKIKIESLIGNHEYQNKTSLSEIISTLETIISDTRTMSLNVSPPLLFELGLESALEWLVDSFKKTNNINFNLNIPQEKIKVSEDIRVLFYQCIKELFVNVIKHSEAQNVDVFLYTENGFIRADVKDDGVGLNVKDLKPRSEGGFGLFSIKERLDYIGGTFDYESEESNGALFKISAPLKIHLKTKIGTK